MTLSKGAVKGAVDGLSSKAKARCRVPVDHQVFRKPRVLKIGADIGDLGNHLHPLEHARRPLIQERKILSLKRVLILRVALASTDANVLIGLQEQRGAGHAGGLAAKPGNHFVRRSGADTDRLELAKQLRGVAAAAAKTAAAGTREGV